MICPKCAEGMILSVKLKTTGEVAQLCDLCETIWYAGEDVVAETGHAIESYIHGNSHEYTIEDIVEEDDANSRIRYVDYK